MLAAHNKLYQENVEVQQNKIPNLGWEIKKGHAGKTFHIHIDDHMMLSI
jgi:hypothetical protein